MYENTERMRLKAAGARPAGPDARTWIQLEIGFGLPLRAHRVGLALPLTRLSIFDYVSGG
jgi:hypothetical protein